RRKDPGDRLLVKQPKLRTGAESEQEQKKKRLRAGPDGREGGVYVRADRSGQGLVGRVECVDRDRARDVDALRGPRAPSIERIGAVVDHALHAHVEARGPPLPGQKQRSLGPAGRAQLLVQRRLPGGTGDVVMIEAMRNLDVAGGAEGRAGERDVEVNRVV